MIKKLWHDPVWSKVIATSITGMPGLFAWIGTHLGWWWVTIPLWLVLLVTLPLFTITILFYRASKAARNNQPTKRCPGIRLQVTTLDPRSSDPKITYKAKLRLVFTNASGQAIHVLPPSWVTGPNDVSVQFPFGYRYQTETTMGSRNWNKQELLDVSVNPGWSFSVYIGLDESVPHLALEKRRGRQQLGKLIIPVRIGSEICTVEERV